MTASVTFLYFLPPQKPNAPVSHFLHDDELAASVKFHYSLPPQKPKFPGSHVLPVFNVVVVVCMQVYAVPASLFDAHSVVVQKMRHSS
jgi:hypothetical protein